MKKLLLLTLLITTLACGRDIPMIGLDEPFVVTAVAAHYGGKYCRYLGTDKSDYDIGAFTSNGAIIAPCGIYNIGDTIKLDRQ